MRDTILCAARPRQLESLTVQELRIQRGSDAFEFRAESFNIWNHTEFNQVSNALGVQQLRPGDVCLRSESLSVRSETVLLTSP